MARTIRADHYKKVATTLRRKLKSEALKSAAQKKVLLDEADKFFRVFIDTLLNDIFDSDRKGYQAIDWSYPSYVFWSTNRDIHSFLRQLGYFVREISFSISKNRSLQSEDWETCAYIPFTEEQYCAIKDAPDGAIIFQLSWINSSDDEDHDFDYEDDSETNPIDWMEYPVFWESSFVKSISSEDGRHLLKVIFDNIEQAANHAEFSITFSTLKIKESSLDFNANAKSLVIGKKLAIEIADNHFELSVNIDALCALFESLGFKVDGLKPNQTENTCKLSWGRTRNSHSS